MLKLTDEDRVSLMNAIAFKEGTVREIANAYEIPVPELKAFYREHREEIMRIRDGTAEESEEDAEPDLDSMWIANKTLRIARYQAVAEMMFVRIQEDPDNSTLLREFRSYLTSVANELGQLLHRGSGDSGTDQLNVEIQGVNWENLQ